MVRQHVADYFSLRMKTKKATKSVKPGKADNAPELKKLGARIKALRLKNGYTNHEIFAYENGIDRVQFGRYERGSSDMQYSSLLKVVKAFNMTLEEFFSEGF